MRPIHVWMIAEKMATEKKVLFFGIYKYFPDDFIYHYV